MNLPDPESEKQHIKRGNQYNCCMNCWLTQNNPDTSGWTRNIQSELVALWFNEQQLPGELMNPAKQKALVMQNPVCNKETTPLTTPQALRQQQFSAIVATYVLQDGIETDDDCFAGNKRDESDTNTSDNDSDSGDIDDEMYS